MTSATTPRRKRDLRCPFDCELHEHQPRATQVRDWLADQPGAWVMALSPALAGLVLGTAHAGRLSLATLWLFVCWTLCYCVEFTAARWLKSRGNRRYLPPVVGYGLALALIGVPFVTLHPTILLWAPPFALLAAGAFAAAWLRRERSLWGNAVAVIAACLMAPLAYAYSFAVPSQDHLFSFGMMLALVFFAVEFGSVLFVKTMIRERGKRTYLIASWLWHVAFLLLPLPAPIVVAAGVLLARAIALPLIARCHRVKPLVTGMVEMVVNIIVFAGVLLAWL